MIARSGEDRGGQLLNRENEQKIGIKSAAKTWGKWEGGLGIGG